MSYHKHFAYTLCYYSHSVNVSIALAYHDHSIGLYECGMNTVLPIVFVQ